MTCFQIRHTLQETINLNHLYERLGNEVRAWIEQRSHVKQLVAAGTNRMDVTLVEIVITALLIRITVTQSG